MSMRRSFDEFGSGLLNANSETRLTLNEDQFHRVISLERRRMERSRKSFLLMLLELDYLLSGNNQRVLAKVLSALSTSTRETDVTGWYRGNSVVGVMFTEIGTDDKQSGVMTTLTTRVSDTLRNCLTAAQFVQLSISFYLLPEEQQPEVHAHTGGVALYPELAARENANPTA